MRRHRHVTFPVLNDCVLLPSESDFKITKGVICEASDKWHRIKSIGDLKGVTHKSEVWGQSFWVRTYLTHNANASIPFTHMLTSLSPTFACTHTLSMLPSRVHANQHLNLCLPRTLSFQSNHRCRGSDVIAVGVVMSFPIAGTPPNDSEAVLHLVRPNPRLPRLQPEEWGGW